MQKAESVSSAFGRMSSYETADSSRKNFSTTAASTAKSSNIMRRLMRLRFEGRGRLYSFHRIVSHLLVSRLAKARSGRQCGISLM